jgi:alkyl hydroperoxide reductase subunit AhpF
MTGEDRREVNGEAAREAGCNKIRRLEVYTREESVALAEKTYDTVVVGSGPSGYTAALYAARANLDTLVFQGFESGGQLMLTSDVENYPGYKDGVAGPDMMDDLEAQAARFGAEMRPDNVERVDFSERPFKLWAEGEDEPVLANTVIIATGRQGEVARAREGAAPDGARGQRLCDLRRVFLQGQEGRGGRRRRYGDGRGSLSHPVRQRGVLDPP